MKKVIASILSLTILSGSVRNISFAEETQTSSVVQQKNPQNQLDTNLEETVKKAIEKKSTYRSTSERNQRIIREMQK